MSKRKDKGRLAPFVPLLISTIDSPTWRATSHGAKSLYVALKRRVPNGRNRAYVSHRQAIAELKSSRRKISEWFAELRHYGFIILAQPGCLGVEGKGQSPHWRLTELGVTSKASAEGAFEPPTNDFLKWSGRKFDPAAFRARNKKQKPGSYGGATLVPTWEPVPVPTGEPPKDESGSHGVAITSLTTSGDSDARLVALEKWGRNSCSRRKKPWSKPTILSDEPRDFTRWPLERNEAAA